jgi:cation diffusion facilitator family transporter
MSTSDRHGRSQGHGHGHGHGHRHGHEHGEESGRFVGWARSLFRPHSHEAADSVDSALESNAAGIRAVKISLAGLGVTSVAQALLVVFTGSVALLADTVHNFSDALTAVPLWIAFVLARRPASRRYTYGFGRAEDLAGVFIVAMIILSALVAGYESVRRLLDPRPLEHTGILIVAGLIGFAGNELVAVYRIRVGRQIGSAALVADGLHARTDGFTSLAVVLGALGVLAGFRLADPIVGLVITAAILVVLKGAATDIYRRLMDAVDPALVDTAEHTIHTTTGVESIEELRLRWSGHRIHGEVSIVADPSLSLIQGHEIANEVHHRLLHQLPKLEAVTVHVSPRDTGDTDHHAALAHHRQPR